MMLDIVKPFADTYGVSFNSFQENRLRKLGEALNAKSLTADQAVRDMEKDFGYKLTSNDKREIAKKLDRLTR